MIETYTINGFLEFVREREKIRTKRSEGYVTSDEILRTKRFCNISREHDRGTIELWAKIKDLSLEEKILVSFYYRICGSSNKVLEYVNPDLESFKEYIRTHEKIMYHQGYAIPYQIRIVGFGSFRNLFLEIFQNEKKFLDLIFSWKSESYKTAASKLRAFVNNLSPGKSTTSLFVFFQFILDLRRILPESIDPNSKIFWGTGSLSALKKMSINESKTTKEIIEILSKDFDLVILEHALCEYNKYSSYVLGKKSFKNKSTNYKPRT